MKKRFSEEQIIGFLKKIAIKQEWEVDVHYYNVEFAKLVGERFYHNIAAGVFPTHALIGEWIFSNCLPNCDSVKNEFFVRDIVEPLFKNGIYKTADDQIRFEEFDQLLRAARKNSKDFVEECASRILDTAPALIGITSVFQQHVASSALARALKTKDPDVFIVMGGANCEGIMGRTLLGCAPWIDAVVSGEGENAFQHILDQLKIGRRPAQHSGIYLQKRHFCIPRLIESRALDESVELDSLPIPDYSDYFDKLREMDVDCSFLRIQIPFESARGCWWGEKHHCTFCGLNGQSMAFRSKSADRAYNELVDLISSYPNNLIGVTDNILDMKYFRDLLPRLSQSRLGIELFYEVKANLSLDQLKILRSAGVTHIQPGIESFSDEVLGLMRKGVRAIQNVQILRDSAVAGVVPEWNILFGFPGESPVEYERIAAILPSIYHLKPPTGASQLRLDRFSPLFESAEELGVVSPTPVPAYGYIYPYESTILQNLAYYFQFSYKDNRDVPTYARPLADLIQRWKQAYNSSELISIDKTTFLLLWDTRPSRHSPLTVLMGIKRDIYLYFTKATSKKALLSIVDSNLHDFIDEFLREMLVRRLMIEIDNRFLALALPIEQYYPKPLGLTALIDSMREISANADDSETLVIPIELYNSQTPEPHNMVSSLFTNMKSDDKQGLASQSANSSPCPRPMMEKPRL